MGISPTVVTRVGKGSTLSTADMDGNMALLQGVVSVPFAKLIVVGDSISVYGAPNWPSNLGFGQGVAVDLSLAAGGELAENAVNQLPNGAFDALTSFTRTNVVLLQRGTNDLTYAAIPQNVYNAQAAMVTQAKTDGCYVGIATVLPQGDTGNRTRINTYNALVRANTANADFIIDFAADPIMGDAAAPGNPALYSDGVHPTQEGYNRMAAIASGALRAWVTAPARTIHLKKLSLSSNTATVGQAFNATIQLTTFGSTIGTVTSSDGTTINRSGTSISGNFTSTGIKNISITETLAGKPNSPRTTVIPVTVSAALTQTHVAKISTNTASGPPTNWSQAGYVVDFGTGSVLSWAFGGVGGTQTYGGKSTGNGSGIVPDAVLLNGAFGAASFGISGLDNSKKYSVELVGSIDSALGYSSSTDYTIGGVTKTLNTLDNTANSVVFSNLSPSAGSIGIAYAPTSGSALGLINAIIVREFA